MRGRERERERDEEIVAGVCVWGCVITLRGCGAAPKPSIFSGSSSIYPRPSVPRAFTRCLPSLPARFSALADAFSIRLFKSSECMNRPPPNPLDFLRLRQVHSCDAREMSLHRMYLLFFSHGDIRLNCCNNLFRLVVWGRSF